MANKRYTRAERLGITGVVLVVALAVCALLAGHYYSRSGAEDVSDITISLPSKPNRADLDSTMPYNNKAAKPDKKSNHTPRKPKGKKGAKQVKPSPRHSPLDYPAN